MSQKEKKCVIEIEVLDVSRSLFLHQTTMTGGNDNYDISLNTVIPHGNPFLRINKKGDDRKSVAVAIDPQHLINKFMEAAEDMGLLKELEVSDG